MTLINPPTWMQGGSYPARSDRLVIAALMSYPGFLVDESTPLRIRQGVKPSYQNYQLKVRAAATPNMTVLVSAGFAFIDQHDTGGVGTYVCVNDGDVSLTVNPAGGAGQYRKDTVVASVYDAELSGSASEWRLEVIQGPYAASAGATVRGTLPNNAQILADLAIGPSQSSIAAANISDLRNFSVAAGGIVPVSSSNAPNRMHPGQLIYLTDLGIFRYGKLDGSSGDFTPDQTIAWTTPALASQYTQGDLTTNGNLQGPIRYRKVRRNGTDYMEWDGGAQRVSGSQVSNILNAALAATFRPAGRASFTIARNAAAITGVSNSGGVVHSVKIDFNQDGTVSLVSATAGDSEVSWFSLRGISYPLA
ncbi:hypothetical protein ACFWFU_06875 [Streptomyces sp. NPDC060235]|uniref:hypothetical protein n=1 Tax=Streptomyces sp. NPDC060235 TaxID=3347080 RepID=UPI00364FFAB4